MIRAIIWSAVSSPDQAKADKVSLAEQEELCRAFCAAQGFTVVDHLQVPGHSRAETDILTLFEDYAQLGCMAYHNLREHWQRGDFDVLVAFHPSRVGRSMSIQALVFENIVKRGRRIYFLQGGWVDDANAPQFIALSGMAVTSESRYRTAMSTKAKSARVAAGLHANKPPVTHRVVRDERGNSIKLELREDVRATLDAAADLLLAGHGWGAMANRLKAMGYRPLVGVKWGRSTLWKIFHTPHTWGHSAEGFNGRYGLWACDASAPLPAGVRIFRDTLPAVWVGERALAIQDELRRRTTIIKGRSAPRTKYALTGLLVCSTCGRRLTVGWNRYNRKDGTEMRSYYWACPWSRNSNPSEQPCTEHKVLGDARARAQISAFLARYFQTHGLDPATLNKAQPSPSRAEYLAQEIAAIEAEIDALILQQIRAPEAVRSRYDGLLAESAKRLETTRSAHSAQQAQLKPHSVARQRDALAWLLANLDTLWSLEPMRANQALFAALGAARFRVQAGVIIDVG